MPFCPSFIPFIFPIYLYVVYMYLCLREHGHMPWWCGKIRGKVPESVLSFHHGGSGGWTQVARLCNQCLYLLAISLYLPGIVMPSLCGCWRSELRFSKHTWQSLTCRLPSIHFNLIAVPRLKPCQNNVRGCVHVVSLFLWLLSPCFWCVTSSACHISDP